MTARDQAAARLGRVASRARRAGGAAARRVRERRGTPLAVRLDRLEHRTDGLETALAENRVHEAVLAAHLDDVEQSLVPLLRSRLGRGDGPAKEL